MLLAGATAVGVGTATLPRSARPATACSTSSSTGARVHGVARVRRPHRCHGGTMMTRPADPRDHLVLVLDVGGVDDALALSRERMSPWFGIVKVGYELYAEAGPEAFDALARHRASGCSPTSSSTTSRTPSNAAHASSAGTASTFLNFHAAGGDDDAARGRRGTARGRARRGTRAADRARGHRAHERPDAERARVAHA